MNHEMAEKSGVIDVKYMKLTSLFSLLSAACLIFVACDQNVRPYTDRPAPPVPMAGMLSEAAPKTQASSPGGAGTISGTITISSELSSRLKGTEIMFIMARSDGGGAPVAVKRVAQFQFPLKYTLSSADQMVQGGGFSGPVEVVARIDSDGSAGPMQPGDMEGSVANATVGGANVDIVIDRVR